ncbi:hypothetical protein ASE31_22065 [Acidovorax sp. Root217]|nr:hypothetical protein ASE31_22065 [Acidovorax sp. Root217]
MIHIQWAARPRLGNKPFSIGVLHHQKTVCARCRLWAGFDEVRLTLGVIGIAQMMLAMRMLKA